MGTQPTPRPQAAAYIPEPLPLMEQLLLSQLQFHQRPYELPPINLTSLGRAPAHAEKP